MTAKRQSYCRSHQASPGMEGRVAEQPMRRDREWRGTDRKKTVPHSARFLPEKKRCQARRRLQADDQSPREAGSDGDW